MILNSTRLLPVALFATVTLWLDMHRVHGQMCTVTITNPPSMMVVSNEVTAIDIQGVADASVVGNLSWHNQGTSASGVVPSSLAWAVSNIALAVGTNVIVITGSDSLPPEVTTNSWDNGDQPAYSGSWDDNSNGGSEFNPWSLFTTADNSGNGGHFMAQGQANLNVGPRAWGMYANSGHFTGAIRPLASPLQVGQTLRFSFDNNEVQSGGGVGCYLMNQEFDLLWIFQYIGNQDVYYVKFLPTDLYWTDQGMDISLTLNSPTNMSVAIAVNGGLKQFNSSLFPTNDNQVAYVVFYNSNAGHDGSRNFYINHLCIITEEESDGVSCSDTVTVVRAAYDFTNSIPLFINEVMASNETIADEDGDTSDWIELYYAGAAPINLDGFGLTDNTNTPYKWTLPAVTMNPNSYLRIWASGKDRRIPGNPLHTSYSIAAEGEDIMLTHSNGVMIDLLPARNLPVSISFGRKPDGQPTLFYFDQPTPGAANNQPGYDSLLQRIGMSVPAGFYTSAFDLTMQSDDDGVIVRYTTDGSVPTSNSPAYSGPIHIDSRAGEANNVSMIGYSTGGGFDEGWMPPDGEMFKFTTVRARAFRAGAYPSPVETRSFVVDPASSNRYSMAVISLTTDLTNLFYSTGIYNNPFHRGPDWERPAHIELFEPDGSLGFAQDVGVRIHGGTTRNRPRKSLRIYARAEYGTSWIEYPLFPDKPVTRYKRFLLRNGGNDWGQLIFRDDMMQSLMKGENIDTQHTRPAIVFFNGEYWGIHTIRDRYDDRYLDTLYGTGSETNITMMENDSVYDRGDPAGVTHYNAMRSFLNSPGVANPTNYAYIQTQMDVDSFINLQAANIYFRNTDWPGNNSPYWRYTAAYNPSAPFGLDGRWRWMLLDTDFGFGLDLDYVNNTGAYGPNDATHDTLAMALAPSGPGWPNPPWATFILRRLIDNAAFHNQFINRMADLLNTSFSSNRVVGVIDAMAAEYAPEMDEHIRRWRRPDSTTSWSNHVTTARTFGAQRAGSMRTHIISQFSAVTGTFNVTVNVSPTNAGVVRVNSITIAPETPGVGTEPYPWTGVYFAGVPIHVTATPKPGYRFAGWVHDPGATSETITVSSDISVTALFEEEDAPESPTLIHYWNFNNTGNLFSPTYSIVIGAMIATDLGPTTEVASGTGQDFFAENARFDDPAGAHFRLNNPLGSTNRYNLPTTGFTNIVVKYETRRSGQGSELQVIETTADGTTYQFYTNIVVADGTPVLQSLDFTGNATVDDNPNFGLRIRYEQGGGGTVGNNRFDNVTVEGRPMPGENFPPVPSPIPFQELIEMGSHAVIHLGAYFTDPDPLTFTASSSHTNFVAASLTDSTLAVVPLRRGDAVITVTADDGMHPPVTNTFRVLVYPQAHVLEQGDFSFAEFDPNTASQVYPTNMIFLQNDVNDNTLATDLLYAYRIPSADAQSPQDADFPYAATGRTRINGLGVDGIAFINTGRGRDLGAALLALDTRNVTNVAVSWSGGTVTPNVRIYAIRLQYRIGATGPFIDALNGDEQPVEYVRNPVASHSTNVPTVNLPPGALDQPYVQLMWRYYWVSGDSGARAQLRLDDISINASLPPPVYQSVYPTMYLRGTFSDWAADTLMTLIADYTWQIHTAFGSATNERFKFDVYGDWSENFGDNIPLDGVGDPNGASIYITEGAGTYQITFNDQTKVYSAIKLHIALFQRWRGDNFSETELLDESISGPYADPENTGVANYYRFATGLGRNDDPRTGLPKAIMGPNQHPKFMYRRLLNPLSGALYYIEIADVLTAPAHWRETSPEDGLTEVGAEAADDGITEDVTVLVPDELIDDVLKLRLKIVPE